MVLSLRAEGEQKKRKREGQIGDQIILVGHVEKGW
jgi:hypothetical protein